MPLGCSPYRGVLGHGWFLKQKNPRTKRMCFFVEKALPFGSGVSCALYTRFSNCLKHLVEYLYGRKFTVVNYLDDFLFIEDCENKCNQLVRIFLQVCNYVGAEVSLEKTEWASNYVIFLGILLDAHHLTLVIPEDKRIKALTLLNTFRNKRKSTVKHLQVLTGYLNFLSRAIVPGRAFYQKNLLQIFKLGQK